jgi:hypothetical protein
MCREMKYNPVYEFAAIGRVDFCLRAGMRRFCRLGADDAEGDLRVGGCDAFGAVDAGVFVGG